MEGIHISIKEGIFYQQFQGSAEEVVFGLGCLKDKKSLHKWIVQGVWTIICKIVGIWNDDINIGENEVCANGRSLVTRDNQIIFVG